MSNEDSYQGIYGMFGNINKIIYKRISTHPIYKWFALGLAYISLWAGISLITYKIRILDADHRDFYTRWDGARLSIFSNHDLYSKETTRLIQTEPYEKELGLKADQQGFTYPAQLVVELFPFWFIQVP